jgi:uncharacterized protein YkwD
MFGKPAIVLCLSLAICFAGSSARGFDLNSYRAQNRLPPLHVHASLAALAAGHAADMARRDTLDHAGFASVRGPAGARAENVAYGCGDEACTIRQWSRSAGHRRNMLRRDINGYGLASAMSSSGRRYWALELGGADRASVRPTRTARRRRF